MSGRIETLGEVRSMTQHWPCQRSMGRRSMATEMQGHFVKNATARKDSHD